MTTIHCESGDLFDVAIPPGYLGVSVMDENEAGCAVGLEWSAVPEIARECLEIAKQHKTIPGRLKKMIRHAHEAYMLEPNADTARIVAFSAITYAWNHPDAAERTAVRFAIKTLMNATNCAHLIIQILDDHLTYWICAARSTDDETKH